MNLSSDDCDHHGLSGGGFQSLSDGFSGVLNDIFNCDRFAIELLNFHGDHIRVCSKIMQHLLKSATVQNPHYLSCVDVQQKNIVHHVLNVCIPNGE